MKRALLILLTLLMVSLPATRSQEAAHEVITAENADSLTVIERLGRGRVVDAGWTADGETLVVASATGLWLYDANDLDAEPRFLPSADGQILSMAIHPEDLIVATGHENGVIRLWDMETGKPREFSVDDEVYFPVTLNGIHDSVPSLVFSEDGSWLVSGGPDYVTNGVIHIWYADYSYGYGVPARTMTLDSMDYMGALSATVQHVAISPDNKTVASAGIQYYPDMAEANAMVYSVENGAFLYKEWGDNVAFAPDNTPLFSGNESTLEGYDFLDFCFNDAANSPDGKVMVIAGVDCDRRLLEPNLNVLYIVDPASRQVTRKISGEAGAFSVKFHHDGRKFVAAHRDGAVRIWDLASGTTIKTLQGFHGAVSELSFKPDEPILMSASREAGYYLWDVESSEEIKQSYEEGLFDFEFSQDGKWIAYIKPEDDTCLLEVVEANDLEVLYSFPIVPADEYYNCFFSTEFALHPDNQVAAVSDAANGRLWYEHEISFWELASGQKLSTLDDYWGVNLGFTQDGAYLISSFEDTIRMTDYATRGVAAAFVGGEFTYGGDSHDRVAISPDGKWIVASIDDWGDPEQLYIWNTETGELIFEDRGGVSFTSDIVFSPDSSLVAGTSGGRIYVMTVPAGEVVASFYEDSSPTRSLAFNSDGTVLAAGYDNGVIFLWGVDEKDN